MRLKPHLGDSASQELKLLNLESSLGTWTVASYKQRSSTKAPCLKSAIMGDPRDPSSYSVVPHIKYNTVGGVNGPLVILENVSRAPQRRPPNMEADHQARSNSPDTTRLSP